MTINILLRTFSTLKDGFKKQFSIVNPNFRKTFHVGNLILTTFKGLPPDEEKTFCGHINDLPEDNRIENLEWMTPNENNIMAGVNAFKYRNFKKNIKQNRPDIWESFCKEYNIIEESAEPPKNTIIINGIECLLSPVPYYENVFISIDGKTIFHEGIEKNLWNRPYGKHKSYSMCWFNKLKDTKVHQIMAWAKYGYQKFNCHDNMVCHLDDDSLNNSYENIILGNPKDNGKHQTQNTFINKGIYRYCRQLNIV